MSVSSPTKRRVFKLRLFIGAFAVVGAVAGLYLLLGNFLFSETYDVLAETLSQRGETRAALIGDKLPYVVAANLADEVQQIIESFSQEYPETMGIAVSSRDSGLIASVGQINAEQLTGQYAGSDQPIFNVVDNRIVAAVPFRPSEDSEFIGTVIYVESLAAYLSMRERMLFIAGLSAVFGLAIIAVLLAFQYCVSARNAALLQNVEQQADRLNTINVKLEKEIVDRTQAQRELSDYRDHLEELVQQRTAKLKQAQDELLETSHKAGMAEVAGNVLHNVGNELTTLNVNVELLRNMFRDSRIGRVFQLVSLLEENAENLGDFLTRDPKGKEIPHYLMVLRKTLAQEQKNVTHAIEKLSEGINSVHSVVHTQQKYVHQVRLDQKVSLNRVVEDAFKMMSDHLAAEQVQIQTRFNEIPPVFLDKQKLLRVLMNLIQNGIEACAGVQEKLLTISTSVVGENAISIAVEDNGKGIEPAIMPKIFMHRFSTKEKGDGQGLHYCGNTVQSMCGQIESFSEGVGLGAKFVITLPILAKNDSQMSSPANRPNRLS